MFNKVEKKQIRKLEKIAEALDLQKPIKVIVRKKGKLSNGVLGRCRNNVCEVVKHLGGKSVNYEFAHEVELSRNWHWMWSKFYFNKKHYGFLFAFFIQLPNFLSAFFKFLLYMLLNNVKKKQIYLHRVSGFVNALTGKNSFYRAKINN